MMTVDLHGVRHHEVADKVISACAIHETPFIIITGNSDVMKRLVSEAASQMGLMTRDAINNPGRVVIGEDV